MSSAALFRSPLYFWSMEARNIASAFFCASVLGSDPYLGRRLMSWAKTTCGTKATARRSARRRVRKTSIETPNTYDVEFALSFLYLHFTVRPSTLFPLPDIIVRIDAHTARA